MLVDGFVCSPLEQLEHQVAQGTKDSDHGEEIAEGNRVEEFRGGAFILEHHILLILHAKENPRDRSSDQESIQHQKPKEEIFQPEWLT